MGQMVWPSGLLAHRSAGPERPDFLKTWVVTIERYLGIVVGHQGFLYGDTLGSASRSARAVDGQGPQRLALEGASIRLAEWMPAHDLQFGFPVASGLSKSNPNSRGFSPITAAEAI